MSPSSSSRHRRPSFGAAMLGAVAAVALLAALAPVPASASTPTWNIARVGAPAAGGGVTIAVVDSGLQRDHPAFGTRAAPQLDCTIADSGCPQRNTGDDAGHGTHVAGTAVGGAVNCAGERVGIGVAPEARVLPIRVLNGNGEGTFADVVDAIDAAVAADAAVVNLSLGDGAVVLRNLVGGSTGFEAALSRAWRAGTIPVLAAGNEGLVGGLLGSGYDGIDAVVVTAVDVNGRRPGYATSVSSNDGLMGIAAPGGTGSTTSTSILSAWSDTQCALSNGTSMATPHVAGALAVLRSRGLSPQQAIDRLRSTAASAGSGTGVGQLDLVAALAGLGGAGSPISTASTSSTTAAPTSTTASTTTSTTTTTATSTTSREAPSSEATPDRSTTTESAPATSAAPSTSAAETTDDQSAAPQPDAVVLDADDGARDVGLPLAATGSAAVAAAWLVVLRGRRGSAI